jgi:hypothetical protein
MLGLQGSPYLAIGPAFLFTLFCLLTVKVYLVYIVYTYYINIQGLIQA